MDEFSVIGGDNGGGVGDVESPLVLFEDMLLPFTVSHRLSTTSKLAAMLDINWDTLLASLKAVEEFFLE